MSAILEVVEAGWTLGEDGVVYPTAVLDVRGRPDVADLARVHAVEGVGDLVTTLHVDGPWLVLGVVLTKPVRAAFAVGFDRDEHRPLLAHAAAAGHLLLATTPPAGAGPHPLWLAIDLDGDRLAALLNRW